MFRKPKRKKAAGLRKKRPTTEDDDDEDDKEASRELREALKRAKHEHGGGGKASIVDDDGDDKTNNKKNNSLMQSFEDSGKGISAKDLATATVQHHPKAMEEISKSQSLKDPNRNKFLAGPIRAPTNIRTTCRFDYQPDICKDYKDTGFCGFGDTCIYLHDRGDTMSGWQLEQAWEEKQKSKKKQQEEQMERFLSGATGEDDGDGKGTASGGAGALSSPDDGLPFACFLSRKAFEDPIVTTCGHFFNQGSLQEYFRKQKEESGCNDQSCPICKRDTHGVMNQPTKLIAKKRKFLGRKATWQEFMDAHGGMGASNEDDE
jgi:RING finger protein 113A